MIAGDDLLLRPAALPRRPLRPQGPRSSIRSRSLDGLVVGCAQALALVPGTSRSGITITAALLLGFTRPSAARFSFLLAVPISVLAALKSAKDLMDAGAGAAAARADGDRPGGLRPWSVTR